ncbi:hypothetical protein AAMO2058_000062500 [Amorphochlora amoebiformis]
MAKKRNPRPSHKPEAQSNQPKVSPSSSKPNSKPSTSKQKKSGRNAVKKPARKLHSNKRKKEEAMQEPVDSKSGQLALEGELLDALQPLGPPERQPYAFFRRSSGPMLLYGGVTSRDVIEIPCVLDGAECAKVISAGEKYGYQIAKHAQTKWTAFRHNGRIQLDSPKVAEALWCRLSEIQNYGHDRESDGEAKSPFPRLPDGRDAIGLNPNIRLYRYTEGQAFGPHIDESNEVDTCSGAGGQSPGGGRTEYTLLVYLNGGTGKDNKSRKTSRQYSIPNLPSLQGGETPHPVEESMVLGLRHAQ